MKTFNQNIPREKICPDHDAPFDFVYDAFMSKYRMIVAMANRSGGKTMDMAILGVLDTLANDYCESANIAAIRFQADKCMSYMKGFIRHSPELAKRLSGEPTASKVPWSNGSLNEVLVATKSGVNCISGNTLVYGVLEENFDWVPIRELVGKDFYAIAYDIVEDTFIASKATNIHMSGRQAKVFKLTYDLVNRYTGQRQTDSLIGTAHHPILLKNGEYKALATLLPGEQLQPLARFELCRVLAIEEAGYEDVYDMTVEETHNFVANNLVIHNSPHPQKLKADEVDLWDWTILQEAFSMVQSKEGVDGVTILGSTRKMANGPMQRLIDRIEASMRKGSKTERLYAWCALEVMEPLPKHDPEKMAEIHRVFGEYFPERMDLCNGYYKWDDLLEKAGNLDREVLEAQWFCRKPETTGLIYSRFDEKANLAKDFTLDFQALNNGWAQIYIFEDFGSTKDHPDVILFAWIPTGKQEVVIFDELYSWDKSEDELMADFDEKLRSHGLTRQHLSGWIGDPHAATEQLNRANKGLPMMGNKFLFDEQDKLPGEMYNIANGIPHVRKFIEDRRLKLTSNIVELRVELQTYAWKKGPDGRYINVPIKDFDHGCDALRYGLIWLFPTQAWASFSSDSYKNQEEDSLNTTFTAGLYDKTF